jgi:hypothetical protein
MGAVLGRAVLGIVCAALLTGWVPGTAAASHVQCGDVIVQDTTLDSDVVCTQIESNGVVIGADNLTLDLRGHSILGPGASEEDASNGIISNAPRTGLVVKNGSVVGFSQGIDLRFTPGSAASNSLFRDLLLRGSVALEVEGDGNRFERNDVNGGFGTMRIEGDNAVVQHNIAAGGDPDVVSVHGDNPTITHNTIVCGSYGATGLEISGGSGGLVAKNSSTDCNEYGFFVFSPGVVVKHNFGSGGSVGIYAGEGVIDGGHNRGIATGEDGVDCVNLRCK